MSRRSIRSLRVPAVVTPAVALAAAALSLVGCGAPDRTPQIPGPSAQASSSASTATTRCTPAATASYAALKSVPAPGSAPAASLEAQIYKRGRLVVGVSADTRLLGARNLQSNQLEGFDIEMARQVAQAIFGDRSKVQFKAISAAQRVPFLQQGANQGGVDMVARAMTMTCDRWKDVAFAGPYFESQLKLLVRADEKAATLQALGAKKAKVCATNGSTTLAKVAAVNGVQPVGVPFTTDCMVLWQQGQVTAIAADDAILAGLTVQDPSAKIVGPNGVESEPYGLAVSKDHPEFAQFVNAVLDGLRSGGWQDAYQRSGLAGPLGARSQPGADYSRPLP